MRRLAAAAVVASSVIVLAVPAGAGHGCNGTIRDVGGVLYIDDRASGPWVYAESNGQPGLQSGGAHVSGTYADTECNHADPDQLLF